MVEKRTLVFVTLAVVVWAVLASAFTGYYYLQYTNCAEQLDETRDSLNKMASEFNEAITKYNALLSEYSELYGNYSYFTGDNYSELMEPLGTLLLNFSENYPDLIVQEDLNGTYTELMDEYNTLISKGNVTREEFGGLLDKCYRFFSLLTLRSISLSVRDAVMLSVSICIDYGNGTVEWHNGTQVAAGLTLFDLTREIATVNFTYNALMEPGHILITSINDKAQYVDESKTWGNSWIWYYWSERQKEWVFGPVGCDAWMLRDGGIYKWSYKYWSLF